MPGFSLGLWKGHRCAIVIAVTANRLQINKLANVKAGGDRDDDSRNNNYDRRCRSLFRLGRNICRKGRQERAGAVGDKSLSPTWRQAPPNFCLIHVLKRLGGNR
jgi:hypothetical protein